MIKPILRVVFVGVFVFLQCGCATLLSGPTHRLTILTRKNQSVMVNDIIYPGPRVSLSFAKHAPLPELVSRSPQCPDQPISGLSPALGKTTFWNLAFLGFGAAGIPLALVGFSIDFWGTSAAYTLNSNLIYLEENCS